MSPNEIESSGALKKLSTFSLIIFLTVFFILLIEKRDCENIFLPSIRSKPFITPYLLSSKKISLLFFLSISWIFCNFSCPIKNFEE